MIPKAIFLLLIPGTIYSVALIDLLRIFRSKKLYWEPVLWGLFLYISIITGWINLYDDIHKFETSLFLYTMYMLGPLVFAQAVHVISPVDAEVDLKEHFLGARKTFFTLATIVVTYNLIFQFILDDSNRFLLRSVLILFYGANIFIDKFIFRLITLIISLIASAMVFILELY